MATGFSALGICHTTSAQALAAYWQSQPVTSVAATGATNVFFAHYNYFNSGLGVWQRYTYRCTQSTGAQTCTASSGELPTFTAQSCTLPDSIDSFTDGALLGWAVLAAMAATWAVMQMRRAL